MKNIGILRVALPLAGLLLIPFASLTELFFHVDNRYIHALSVAERLHRLTDDLPGELGAECKSKEVCSEESFSEPLQALLQTRHAMKAYEPLSSRRRAPYFAFSFNLTEEEIARRVPLLGRAIPPANLRAKPLALLEDFRAEVMEYCCQQVARFRRDEPPLPPMGREIEPLKASLLGMADEIEQASRPYSTVRLPLRIFFYAWAIFQVVGLSVFFFHGAKEARRRLKELREKAAHRHIEEKLEEFEKKEREERDS